MKRKHHECFPLQSLPDDVLQYLSRFLDNRQLRILRLVNRCFGYHPRIIQELQRRTYIVLQQDNCIDNLPHSWLYGIQKLYIRFTFLKPLTTIPLHFTNLRILVMDCAQERDYTWIGLCTTLEDLNLRRCPDIDWAFLSGLTQLRRLNMETDKMRSMTFLGSLTTLRSLFLWKRRGDLTFLESVSYLEALHLTTYYEGDLKPLRFLSQLQWLTLPNYVHGDITDIPFSITKLSLDRFTGNVTALKNLCNLKSLDLASYADGHFDVLPPSLQNLRVRSYSGSLTALCCCRSLEILDLKVHKNQDLNDLSPLLPLLRGLVLRVPSNINLNPLGTCFNLRELCLWDYDKGDLTFLSFMCSLTKLYLPFYEEGDITPISFLFSLRMLDLAQYKIGQDISCLASLWKLQDLILSEEHPHGEDWKEYLATQRTIQQQQHSK